MSRKTVAYRWHLRRLMAEAGMFATTDMVPPLADRGITLSREQVYRLVTGVPERLSLPVLAALCDILDCGPGDLIEPVRKPARKDGAGRGARAAAPAGARAGHPRARRTVTARCPAGHELPGGRRQAAGMPAMPAGHADPARHLGGRDAARERGRGRGRRGRRHPGRAAGAGLGAGRRP